MNAPPRPSDRPLARARRAAGWLLAALALAWAYTWAPEGLRGRLLTPEAVDHYREYADALLAGQLHLDRAPDPRLVALPDPYDPVANEPYRVNDLSYRDGRYYLYHSLVPALLVLAPVKWATGQHLAIESTVALFAVVGSLSALALLAWFRRRHAPAAGTTAVAVAAIAAATSGGLHVVLHGGAMNQLPIAAAHGFGLLGLALLLPAEPGARRVGLRLAAAGVALALAVACRPNWIFAVAALGALAAFLPVRSGPAPLRAGALRAVLAGTPVALGVGLLLALNHARFGKPFEFGMRLMLGAWDQRDLPSLGQADVLGNLGHYLLGAGRYQAVFPFVTAPDWTALGTLRHAPFAGLLLLPLLPALRRAPLPGGAVVLAVATTALVNLAVLALLPSGDPDRALTSANARYALDFQAPLVLAAGLALLAAAHAGAARPAARRLLLGTSALLAAVSALAALSLHLGRYPTESIRPLARWLSAPTWAWEAARGREHGPLAVAVRFPAGRTDATEPLLAVGDAAAGDLVTVRYDSPDTLRLALLGVGREGPESAPVRFEPGRTHTIELQLGPLMPPPAHPSLANWPDAAAARLSRRAVVRFDGRTVLDEPVSFVADAGAPWTAGATSFLLDRSAPAFSGTIESVRRLPPASPPGDEPPPLHGPLRLTLRLPSGRDAGTEPLVTTGVPRAGDVLHVTYGSDGHIRFGFDHWGARGTIGPWIAVAPEADHVVEVWTGALFPPDGHPALARLAAEERRRLKERLRIVLDGRVVLDAPQAAYDSSPLDVVVGRNPIGASSAAYRFTGEVRRVERPAWP